MKISGVLRENYATMALWIMLFFILWFQAAPQSNIIEGTLFVVIFLVSSYPFVTYLSTTLLQRAIKEKKTTTFIFQSILFSLIVGLLFLGSLFIFYFLEKKGVFPPSDYFDMDVELFMLFVPLSAGVLVNVCICGMRFFEENNKLKKTLLEYQLRTLQHQVTPHFMFNVLNHIHILMQTDVELASDLLIKYSEILRYQLYNGDKEKVKLEQDIQFLKHFISVEALRWEDKLSVSCTWKIENGQKEIPALLFITFIENAFKYVSKSDFEKGFISIDFEQQGEMIRLEVKNSKSSIQQKEKLSGKLGLKNIKERLDILYYGKYNLFINETESLYQTILVIST